MSSLTNRLSFGLRRAGVVTATTVQAATFAAARLLTEPANGTSLSVPGRDSVNDGFGGTFAWDESSVAADDNENTIKITSVTTGRWVRISGDNALVLVKTATTNSFRGVYGLQSASTVNEVAVQDVVNGLRTELEYTERVYNVVAYGAVGNGSTDDSAAIQAAIAAAIAAGGGVVFFPARIYAVSTTITVGTGGATIVDGVVLRGESRAKSLVDKTTLKWTGASAGGPIMRIRGAHSGEIHNINFDGRNLAFACLQAQHTSGVDTNTSERWTIAGCRFESGRDYNVLIGGTTPSADDCSAWMFLNCYFGRSWTNALTTAHVRINGWNSFGVTFMGCQWYGTAEGATYYPLHAISAVGGNFSVHGGSFNAMGQSDVHLFGNAGCQPSGATIVGVESQSYCLLETDTTGSSTPQWPVTIIGCYHSDSSAAGSTRSVIWDIASGFAPLTMVGFRPSLDVEIAAGAQVFAQGVVFASGADFVGAGASNVVGHVFQNTDYRHTYRGANRRALNAYDSTYGLGAYQTYGSLCPQAFSLANDGTFAFAASDVQGMLMVKWDGNPLAYGATAIFILHFPVTPGTGVSAIVSDPSSQFSITKDNASTVNVYWDSGTSRWTVQNKLGGGARMHVALVGSGPAA